MVPDTSVPPRAEQIHSLYGLPHSSLAVSAALFGITDKDKPKNGSKLYDEEDWWASVATGSLHRLPAAPNR